MDRDFWWIENGVPENERLSGCVRKSVRERYKNFSKMRQVVWKWYRSRAGDTKLSPASKLTLWAICERFRVETFSSHDAYKYYAKMTGLSNKTVGRCVSELIERGVLWCAKENERVLLKKAAPGVRKHLLLVGLGYLLVVELREVER